MKEFFIWCRDKGGSFILTFWLQSIAIAVIAWIFWQLLMLDGHFSKSLAEGSSLDPFIFMAIGWGFRFFAVIFLMGAEREIHQGYGTGKTWTRLGWFCSAIVFLHALGIGLEALDSKRDDALAQRAVVEVQSAGVEDQLAELNRQESAIQARLTEQVAPLNAEINRILNDGIVNDDEADAYKERRSALQDAANAQLAEINSARLALVATSAETSTDLIDDVVKSDAFSPIFFTMAQVGTLSWEPSDRSQYVAGVLFLMFWVLLAEAICIFLPKRIYVSVLHAADAATDRKRSEAAKKGWEERKKRERQTNKIELQASSYMDKYKKALRYATTTNYTVEGIANTAFKSSPSMMESNLSLMVRAGLIDQDDVELIMRRVDPPEQKNANSVDAVEGDNAQLLNGQDKGEDDADDAPTDRVSAS